MVRWAPEAVCSSSTAAKRSLGKRLATRTRAGHRRRWMSVIFPSTSRVENAAEYREDLVAGRMSPPAAADGFTGDVFGKIEYGAACGLQDDALLAHPFQRLHDHRFNHAFRAVHQTLRL